MYEAQTFSAILERMLERVPDTVDKREGSVIYDALAPAAAELAQLYAELDVNNNLTFADTASGDYLTRRTAEFGVNRKPAVRARRMGLFYGGGDAPFDVPIGSRYSVGGIHYAAVARIAAGQFELDCEVAGIAGNQQFGALLPLDYIEGLARAEIADVIVPGAEEESDAELRVRFFAVINEKQFGGDVSDYLQMVGGLTGVGGVKVFPAWQGGGTVKVTIIAADWNAPAAALVNEVQAIVDPELNSGQGLGIAPIGHQVTVAGVAAVDVNIETTITLGTGVTTGQVQADIEAVLDDYLTELRKDWANQEAIIVRVSQIDARILTVSGVEDVSATKVNGLEANLALAEDQIPKMGTVVVHE